MVPLALACVMIRNENKSVDKNLFVNISPNIFTEFVTLLKYMLKMNLKSK